MPPNMVGGMGVGGSTPQGGLEDGMPAGGGNGHQQTPTFTPSMTQQVHR